MFGRIFLATLLLFGTGSVASAATTGFATANVNLRAGPSTSFPAVIVIPAGAPITTYACLSGYSWCDISFETYRGWVAASYIQIVYQGRPVVVNPNIAPAVGLAVVAFSKAYWDNHYRSSSWYGSWDRYRGIGPDVQRGVVRDIYDARDGRDPRDLRDARRRVIEGSRGGGGGPTHERCGVGVRTC